MFCPLCKAEYREGFATCSTCGATLVADDADASQRNPAQLRWATQDRGAFDRAVAQLREARVPCLEKSEADHWLYAIQGKRATFHLFILARDAEAAKLATGIEFQARLPEPERPKKIAQQLCPLCRTEFPESVEQCPGCGANMTAWKPQEEAPGQEPVEGESAPTKDEDGNPTELVWRGSDPVAYSRALLALREAGIMHVPLPGFEHLAFEMAIPRPRLGIRVYRGDSERARELLLEFQDPFPLVPQGPAEIEAAEGELSAEVDAATGAPPLAEPEAEEVESAAEYETRKTNLRRGGGLVLLSVLLGLWGLRAFEGFPRWHTGMPQLKSAASYMLIMFSVVGTLAAFWYLYRSWAWRADKIGFLAWFFGWKGMMWLGSLVFLSFM
jgi:hypothetical protein